MATMTAMPSSVQKTGITSRRQWGRNSRTTSSPSVSRRRGYVMATILPAGPAGKDAENPEKVSAETSTLSGFSSRQTDPCGAIRQPLRTSLAGRPLPWNSAEAGFPGRHSGAPFRARRPFRTFPLRGPGVPAPRFRRADPEAFPAGPPKGPSGGTSRTLAGPGGVSGPVSLPSDGGTVGSSDRPRQAEGRLCFRETGLDFASGAAGAISRLLSWRPGRRRLRQRRSSGARRRPASARARGRDGGRWRTPPGRAPVRRERSPRPPTRARTRG